MECGTRSITGGSKMNENSDSIKDYLRRFSAHLRRDFLVIIVKMASRELNIQTVRNDWRTREGMMRFLSRFWEKIVILIEGDSVFNWFCTNFEKYQQLFEHKKFMLFIQMNWKQYGKMLKLEQTKETMRLNISTMISFVSSISEKDAILIQSYDSGYELYEMFVHYHGKPEIKAEQVYIQNPVLDVISDEYLLSLYEYEDNNCYF